MLLSIWRYSHLTLALSSLLFVGILSVTGLILAFDPVSTKLQNTPSAERFPEQTLAETLEALSAQYSEVLSLEVDANGFVLAAVITEEGDLQEFYIHPATAEKTLEPAQKSALIEFATNLHRSLFLKSWGRFFVGLNSLLLFLIVLTGLALILKRQQGIKHFFSKIVNEHFWQFSHVYLGRLMLLSLVLITLSGVYLSLLRFEIIPETPLSHDVNVEQLSANPEHVQNPISIFENTPLKEIRSLEFPFSDDATDYYTLSLHDRELLIHQYSGEVLSEVPYPLVTIATQWSLALHTGEGSYLWSIVLALSCLSIFFFMVSGIKMTLQRRSSKIRNTYSKNESSCIILVGSETGSTIAFAREVQEQLKKQEVKSFVASLNNFDTYPNMKHLLVLTATYGQGEPPANATKFQQKLRAASPQNPFTFSVLGFGSLGYPDFCKFAFDVDTWLEQTPNATRLLPLHTVHNRSRESFKQWVQAWGKSTHLNLNVAEETNTTVAKRDSLLLEVQEKVSFNNTFTLRLKARQSTKFTSGDLLAIYPSDGSHERLYSVSLLQNGHLLISIKKHPKGVCSTELSQLQPGALLEGKWVQNKGFHFPKKNRPVVLISSGTGIAPFLGMLENNYKQTEVHLYWGGHSKSALSLYAPSLTGSLQQQSVSSLNYAFSRETGIAKTYVQDVIQKDAKRIAQVLKAKGTLMLCGSVAMQQGVTEVLQRICQQHNQKPLSYYQKKGRIKIDCY